MDKEDDLRQRIGALEELITLEHNARLSDLKAHHLRKMSAKVLQTRQREREENTTQHQQEIIELQRQLRAIQVVWETGSQLDTYILQRVLGSGGNGQVWLADEPLLDGRTRPVAIKVLRESIAQNPERVQRFRYEISMMARINQRHIVPIYTYGEQGGQLYAVMPYFAGGTLRERLTGEPIAEAQAMNWLEQIGVALDHVHDRYSGLIHRDVKPENILLSDEGDMLYLADFGLVFSSEDHHHITEGDKPVGTGRYMAPEQWNREHLSRQTDLYALGILAYELLTGHLPFQETNDLALGNAHCERDLPADPYLPDEMLQILRKAAAKYPLDRYPTARAFLTELRNWRLNPATITPRIRGYLTWATEDAYDRGHGQFVELGGDETRLRRRPVRPKAVVWDDDDLFTQASAERQADLIREDDAGTVHFVENVRERLLSVNRAVLVGEPGSGKSWMLRHLQADYARAWLTGSRSGRRLVPVLIRLNEYTSGSFADMVKSALDTLAPYHDRLQHEKRLVILCDALNEMPRGAGQMKSLIHYLKTAPYFVVSCRVRDYRDDLGDLKPLDQLLLRELDLPAMRELIYKRLPGELGKMLWHSMGGTETLEHFWDKVYTNNESAKFWISTTEWSFTKNGYRWTIPKDWHAIHQGSRLIPLCRSPYLADLLCRAYRVGLGSLPDSRARLFEQFINEMLRREAKTAARRGEVFPPADEIKDSLVSLAWTLQNTKSTVIRETQAMLALQSLEIKAAGLLKAAMDANILSSDGDGLRFAHQLLQEYFASRILLGAMENDESAAQFFGSEWWEAGVWRETVVILGEFLGDGSDGPNFVVRWLAPVTPEVALDVITRHGSGLTLHDIEPETRRLLIESAREKTHEPHPMGRAAAYRVLALWNEDKRSGIGLRANGLPDIEWMPIFGGKFPYGHDDDTDSPAQILNVPAFQMSRYPITYTQFEAFLKDKKGFAYDLWWEGLANDDARRKNQKDPETQAFQYGNHPREMVSWYDAIAFCRWLSYQMGGGYDLDNLGEWAVRLPTEFEWEKGARGRAGCFYPYGNEFDAYKGNTYETAIAQTSAVGIFSQGASPYRLEDMSGNVWEWCLTDYENPSLDPTGENLHSAACRVLRGGSWNGAKGRARSIYRLYNDPFERLNIVGFRCVRPVR